MTLIIINAEEWKELVQKIDRIIGLFEQYTKRLPLDDNVWLNETQVCNYLKISLKTLQRLRKSGEITFSTIAKKHYYKVGEVKKLMEKKSVKSSQELVENLQSFHKDFFHK